MAAPSAKQRAVTLKREGLDDGVVGAILGISSEQVRSLMVGDPVLDLSATPAGNCFEDSVSIELEQLGQQNVEWPSPYVNTFDTDDNISFAVPDNRTLLVCLDATIGYDGVEPASGAVECRVAVKNDDTGTNTVASMGADWPELVGVPGFVRKTLVKPLWSPLEYDHEYASYGNYWYAFVSSSLPPTTEIQFTLSVVEIPAEPYPAV